MTPEVARVLLLSEATSQAGVLVRIRMGEDPGTESMQALIHATKVIFETLKGQSTVDRKLVQALFEISTYLSQNVASWSHSGVSWRAEFTAYELPCLLAGIESIFCDEWIEFVDETFD